MTPRRQRMIEDIQVRNLSPHTQASYLQQVALFARHFRRFLLHVLPVGFHRIRYYGFLGNRYRHEKLVRCQQLLGMTPPAVPPAASTPPKDYRDRYEDLTGWSLLACPLCHHGRMRVIELLAPGHPASSNTS